MHSGQAQPQAGESREGRVACDAVVDPAGYSELGHRGEALLGAHTLIIEDVLKPGESQADYCSVDDAVEDIIELIVKSDSDGEDAETLEQLLDEALADR